MQSETLYLFQSQKLLITRILKDLLAEIKFRIFEMHSLDPQLNGSR